MVGMSVVQVDSMVGMSVVRVDSTIGMSCPGRFDGR